MTAPRERRDASVPVRIHIAIEAYLATWKPARRARVPV